MTVTEGNGVVNKVFVFMFQMTVTEGDDTEKYDASMDFDEDKHL